MKTKYRIVKRTYSPTNGIIEYVVQWTWFGLFWSEVYTYNTLEEAQKLLKWFENPIKGKLFKDEIL